MLMAKAKHSWQGSLIIHHLPLRCLGQAREGEGGGGPPGAQAPRSPGAEAPPTSRSLLGVLGSTMDEGILLGSLVEGLEIGWNEAETE